MDERLDAQPEEIRRLLDAHLAEHGCGTGDTADPRYVGGFGRCPDARRLWDALPPEDRVLLA